MNRVNPKKLLNSKWSKVDIVNCEKHFIVTKVVFDEQLRVIECIIEAVKTNNEYPIDWHELKHSDRWLMGWR